MITMISSTYAVTLHTSLFAELFNLTKAIIKDNENNNKTYMNQKHDTIRQPQQ